MGDLAAIAAEPRDPRAKAELDSGLAVSVGEIGRGLGANNTAHHPLCQLDDMHRDVFAAGDGGEFEADKAGADDDRVPAGGKPLLQRVGLGKVAQVADAVQFDAGQRRHAVARPGGEHEMVVDEAPAVGKRNRFAGPIDRGDRNPAQQLDALIVKERRFGRISNRSRPILPER